VGEAGKGFVAPVNLVTVDRLASREPMECNLRAFLTPGWEVEVAVPEAAWAGMVPEAGDERKAAMAAWAERMTRRMALTETITQPPLPAD